MKATEGAAPRGHGRFSPRTPAGARGNHSGKLGWWGPHRADRNLGLRRTRHLHCSRIAALRKHGLRLLMRSVERRTRAGEPRTGDGRGEFRPIARKHSTIAAGGLRLAPDGGNAGPAGIENQGVIRRAVADFQIWAGDLVGDQGGVTMWERFDFGVLVFDEPAIIRAPACRSIQVVAHFLADPFHPTREHALS